MDGKTTIKYLQNYIQAKDSDATADAYFIKMIEELGELAQALRKGLRPSDTGSVKGTIDEELWDVIYYAITIANCFDIDLENVISEKEALNRIKYNSSVLFEVNR